MEIRIRRIQFFWKEINAQLWRSVVRGELIEVSRFVFASLRREVLEVEHYLKRYSGSRVHDLDVGLFSLLQWFCVNDDRFLKFIEGFRYIFEGIRGRGVESRYFVFSFGVMPYLWDYRNHGRSWHLRVNIGYVGCEKEVLDSILDCCLKQGSEGGQRARAYSMCESYHMMSRILQSGVLGGSSGRVYDLGEIFDFLNVRYFGSGLEKPYLSWGKRMAYRRLGRYIFQERRIVISPVLDDVRVPRLAVEFVMYHEMLHCYLGYKDVGSRKVSHDAHFRMLERKFEGFEEAETFLNNLSRVKK